MKSGLAGFSFGSEAFIILALSVEAPKLFITMLEFGYKNSKLGETPTSLDKVDEKGGDVELGSVHPENEDDIVYHHNPMIQQSHSEDTVPLLRRVDNVEHETKSVKAKTESIEAKTENIEAKTENIEAKTERMEEMFKLAIKEMNEKMEKLANSSNAL